MSRDHRHARVFVNDRIDVALGATPSMAGARRHALH